MLKSKKIISSLLALSMIVATPTVAYAADKNEPATSVGSERSINWTYTSWVGAGISLENDYAQCAGSYELYSDLKSEITISLMKSKDGRNWTTVESWSTTNYQYNPLSFSQKSTDKLQHGYYYLTHTQVQVLDSNDNVLETGNSDSTGKYYP